VDGRAEAVVDLDAIASNTAALASHAAPAAVMAVVKADGYGHGLVQSAVAAVSGGASWLGVGQVAEGLMLRRAGLTVPVLCLLAAPDAPHADAIRHGIDLSAGSAAMVGTIARAAREAGDQARLHLKADTGMGRGGATAAGWPAMVDAALAAQARGEVVVTGLWSHLACADIPGHPSVPAQMEAFRAALQTAERAGARPLVRHLANTAAALTLPEAGFDLVRPGGGIYGLSTQPGGPPGWLRPALTVRATLVQAKQVPAGTAVSYGHRYATRAPAMLGLLPLGYHEGIPRSAGSTAQVLLRAKRRVIAGTVCMNQCVIDAGSDPIEAGDEVLLFGPGDAGEPTAQEWADALGTISYDIVTRFSGAIPRSYAGGIARPGSEAVPRARTAASQLTAGPSRPEA
jgi:alanine racemase